MCTSRTANVGVSIKHVSLSFPLGLIIASMSTTSPRGSALLDMHHLRIGIRLLPLLGGRIRISNVSLRKTAIGSGSLVRNVGLGNALKRLFVSDRKITLSPRATVIGGILLGSASLSLYLGSATTTSATTDSAAC